MASARKRKTGVNLRVTLGTVVFRETNLPPIKCPLLKISQAGCRCLVLWRAMTAEEATVWQAFLQPSRALTLEISMPPYLDSLTVAGSVREVIAQTDPQELEAVLSFAEIEPAVQSRLERALLSLATEKVREGLSGRQARASAPYLVGSSRTPAARPSESPEPAAPPPPLPPGPPSRDRFRGMRLGDVLVALGKLTELQMEEAALVAQESNEKIGRHLVRSGQLKPAELCHALALQAGLPMTNLEEASPTAEAIALFPVTTLAQHRFVPFDVSRRAVCIAVAQPLPAAVTSELALETGRRIEVFLADEELVQRCIENLQGHVFRPQRENPRYALVLPVTYQFCLPDGRPAEEAAYAGRTLDASVAGLCVEGPAPKLGQPEDLCRMQLAMLLRIQAPERELTAFCSIIFVEVLEDVPPGRLPWRMGLQVTRMKEEDLFVLERLCQNAARADGAPAERGTRT